MEFYEKYDQVLLKVHYIGDGPFNVSWFLNDNKQLRQVPNTTNKTDVSI